MAEPAAAALRRKPRASIRVAAEAVRDGRAAALFSAGHTGAAVMAAHARVRPAARRRSPGARDDHPDAAVAGGAARFRRDRRVPAAAPRPVRGHGVGVRARRARLRDAARRAAVGRRGREQGQRADARGASAAQDGAGRASSATSKGATSTPGEADVIVCDGFTGNVTLKISEGLVETVEPLLHDELSATFGTRVGYLLSRQAFRRFRKRVDYSEYGGAPLVGLNGLCIVGHGRSSAKAVRNAVAMAARCVARTCSRSSPE